MADVRTAHPYYMYEAIAQQPDRVARVLAQKRAAIEQAAEAAARCSRLLFVGIGTSFHAAQVAERFLRHLTGGRARAQAEQSFELVHYPLALGPDDGVVLVSHRGWKAYSLQALRAAKAAGALTLAVTGEQATEEMNHADFVLSTCEQEDSSTHTKSYTAALGVLAAFALGVTRHRGQLSDPTAAAQLHQVPDRMRHALAGEPQTREAAKGVAPRQRLIFVGAGPNWITAREAALKVKESSYIAAEGFETEEFLHGPVTEIGSDAAVVALAGGGPADERLVALLRAAGELGVWRVAVAPTGAMAGLPAEHHLEVPAVPEWLSPLVHVVPVQLLSYFLALERGANPDNERREEAARIRALEHYKL